MSTHRTKANPIVEGDIRRITVAHETKAATDDPDGKFAGFYEGIGAGIWNIDLGGDLIPGGAFKETIPDFLKDGVIGWQHNITNPIGIPLDAKETDDGLWNKARISKTALGVDAMILIKDKVVKKQSIGYRPTAYKSVDREGLVAYLEARTDLPADKAAQILRQYDEMDLDRVFILEKIKLFEISPVTLPMNTATSITSAKAIMDGLLDGLKMQDFSAVTLAVVRGHLDRAKQINAYRLEKQMTIGKSSKSDLATIAADLTASAAEINSFLEGLKTAAPGNASATDKAKANLQVYAQFAELENRILSD